MGQAYVTASQVAEAIEGVVWGNPDNKIYGIALPDKCNNNMLTYFEAHNSVKKCMETDFAACIVPIRYKINDDRTYIVINKGVFEVIHKVIKFLLQNGLHKKVLPDAGIHSTVITGFNTFIDNTAFIGENSFIGNNTSIGYGVSIGSRCKIDSSVVIGDCVRIGNNVHIQSGAIIGSDSFEYAEEDGWKKIPNIGTVIIGDNVVIGANTTLARGTIGNTIIGSGTVIDNQVQIGHEVKIGQNCKICAQCALAGWSSIGNNVILYGKTGVSNNVVIEDNAVVLGMSGVTKRVYEGKVVSGNPAKANTEYLREKAALNRLIKKGGLA